MTCHLGVIRTMRTYAGNFVIYQSVRDPDSNVGNRRNFKSDLETTLGDGGWGDQMLMKDTRGHSVEWPMPINFQGGDN